MHIASLAKMPVVTIQRAGRVIAILLLSLVLPIGFVPKANADTLDRIRAAGKILLGYRDDARPFAFKDEGGQPAGFSVALCQMITEDLKVELGLSELEVEWVPITIDDRAAALQQGRVDILCGADSITLERRKAVSFSIPIYPGGIGAIARANAPQALREVLEGEPATGPIWRGSPARILNQRTFAVVAGSTSQSWLAERIQRFQIDVKVVPVENYAAGIDSLTKGNADVFFGDRAIIMEAASTQIASGDIIALERQFTHEPIALTIARDNDALRLVIDQTLSREFKSEDFRELFFKWFGAESPGAIAFYRMSALPE